MSQPDQPDLADGTAGPSSEQSEAVEHTPDGLAPATGAGTGATDLDELGAGGVEDAPSGYLADASPEGVGTAASDAEQDAAVEVLPDADVVAAAPVELDSHEQMRTDLRGLPGDWYVVHSYAATRTR